MLDLRAETCPKCGTREDEWVDDKGRPYEPLYEATVRRCFGCRPIEETRAGLPKRGTEGVYVALRRIVRR